jgi:hypothetical protein
MAFSGLFEKLAGIVGTFFQIGGPSGPGFVDTSTSVISATTANASTLANVRVLTPVVDTDAANKQYVDEAFKPVIVTAQSNAVSALQANTSTEHFTVVTTAGTGAAAAYLIGDLLWDDGSNTGNVVIITPSLGDTIISTVALTGGTLTFVSSQPYVYVGSTVYWQNMSADVAGAAYVIQMTVGHSATYTSTTVIPAGSTILSACLNVTTPYTAAATVEIGQTGTLALLLGTADNTCTVQGNYCSNIQTAWGASALPVVVTTSAPAAGAGTVVIIYTVPLS